MLSHSSALSSVRARPSLAIALGVAVTLAAVTLTAVAPLRAQDASDGRSLAEFRDYLNEKLPQLSEEQLAELATRVDQNRDGVIDDREFQSRMRFVREVLGGGDGRSGGRAPTPTPKPVETHDYLDGEPASLPKLTPEDGASLLLITGDEIAVAWLPFARWKTQQGIATKIMTVRQIAREYEGPTIQEKIRRCVRQHIAERDTRWVLLGGDCEPGGGVVPGGPHTFHEQEPLGIPTDLVYLSPTDWDADGDRLYGEWKDDAAAITYPDGSVGLGRVPVRTAEDVEAFTNKVVAYESGYPTTPFATQMLYTSTESQSTPKVVASWDRHIAPGWRGADWKGEVTRFFADETPWDDAGSPGSYPLSAANLAKAINGKNSGKVHIHGHGLLDRWILEDSKFDAAAVDTLTNRDAYPLITTVSCNTGEYDSATDPSIVENVLRAPHAGSVAVVAPIRTGKMHFHEPGDMRRMVTEGKLDGTTMTMTRYWTEGLHKGATTGEALMAAKASLADDARKSASYHLGVCELNLLGDPTLDFRARVPRRPALRVPALHSPVEGALTIESDAPGAVATAWAGTEYFEVTRTDADGRAEFTLPATLTGELRVTIAGSSLNTVSARVRVGGAAVAVEGDRDGDGKTSVEEFEAYVGTKLSQLDRAQLVRIAKLVDKNADGEVDAAEFEARFEAVQAVMRGDTPDEGEGKKSSGREVM